MGIEFKLTDRELPASPAFVDFLAQHLSGRPPVHEIWAEQHAEGLSPSGIDPHRAAEAAKIVMGSSTGRERVARAYTLLHALLIGSLTPLQELQLRFRFINIVGIPRTGGSYLTAELYRSLGMLPEQVPHAIAHDSFPEAAPFQLEPGSNSWIVSLKTMAEYLTMVETFFGQRNTREGKIVVPKKLTKAVYAGAFFASVLGEDAEYLVTVRHPVASCLSTYEKSGGLPVNGHFAVRSNIEAWCRRDIQHSGARERPLSGGDYFDAYLAYWERYHYALAQTGLSSSTHLQVFAYGDVRLREQAQTYHNRYRSGITASQVWVSDRARLRHPEWLARAEPAIDRVAATWKSVGMRFPADEVRQCW